MAVKRLRRILRIWAVLFAATGLLTLWAVGGRQPLAALPWLAAAVLLVRDNQPIYLALTAVQWGLSLIVLIPGIQAAFGPDPLAYLSNTGIIESIALALVRIIFMITAWNQFLFYRMLYGTSESTGIDNDLPVIPMVISNRSNRLALISRSLGTVGIPMALLALAFRGNTLAVHTLGLAYTCSVLAAGFGLGAAFSPTTRRDAALTGLALGSAAFLLTLVVGRVI
jgi:hypothetical protein